MDEESNWTSEDPVLASLLNEVTEQETELLSPSEGEPREIVFNRIVEMFSPTRTEQDETTPIDFGEIVH